MTFKPLYLCLLLLSAISIHNYAGTINIVLPANQVSEYSILSATAMNIFDDSSEIKILYQADGIYTNSFIVNQPGIYKVLVTVELSSGIVLSDSANGIIQDSNENRVINIEINENCFNPTMTACWSGTPVNISQLYGTSIDTSIIKRVHLEDIDSIADNFYQNGLYWYRTMPVHYDWLDENYIPLVQYSTGLFRNPVTTSHTAFGFYEQYQITHDSIDKVAFINNVNWLSENNHNGYYYYEFDFRHYSNIYLRKNWVSAMAQGEALGALSLAYYFLNDSTYLKEADSVFNTLCHNSEQFWCVLTDEKGYYWMEEYPNNDICHVLNGKMAALWGVFQYYTVTRNKLALRILEAGLKTVLDNYKIWNVPNQDASYYCLHHEIKMNYHDVHKNQFLTFAKWFGLNQFYKVYECFSNNEINISPEEFCFNYAADSAESFINSYLGWSVHENCDWLDTRVEENKLIIEVDSNLTNSIRYAVIDIIVDNGDKRSINITQEPQYYFSIETEVLSFSSDTTSSKYSITTNADNVVIENNILWVDCEIINDSFQICLSENKEFTKRNGKLYFLIDNDTIKEIEISQLGAIPLVTLSTEEINFESYADSITIKIHSNIQDITLLSDQEWLSGKRLNDTTIRVIVQRNEKTDREGNISLLNPYIDRSIHVLQSGIPSIVNEYTADIEVFPNPVKDILNIVSRSNVSTLQYTLTSLSGTVIYEGNFFYETSINVSAIRHGIYILNITSETHCMTYLILVMND